MDDLSKAGRIKELDGLRAISIILVIVYHMVDWAQLVPELSTTVKNQLAFMGVSGVDIFFVISGFIITKLMIDEHCATGSVSLAQFYLKRICRILPVFLFYVVVVLLLGWLRVVDLTQGEVLWPLLFLSNIMLAGNWFFQHTWTLSVEEQYYIVFPIILWKFLKGNPRWCAVVLVGAYILAFCSLKLTTILKTHGIELNICWLYPFRFIICGVLLAVLWPVLTRAFGRLHPAVFLLALAWIIMSGCHFFGVDFGFWFDIVEPPLLALLVLWLVCNPARCGFLRWGAVQWIGACSYSMYLWQQLFTAPPESYLMLKLSDPRISIILILAISGLSYYFIERQAIAFGRRLIKSARAKAA